MKIIRFRVIRPVSQVKQGLLTYPGQLRSPPVLSEVRDARSLDFCVLFCSFVLFSLSIVLSVLQFTTSDYHFGIFNFSDMHLQSI
jgi:hypothetical protein